jgi:ketosteroid isomerase-like protein
MFIPSKSGAARVHLLFVISLLALAGCQTMTTAPSSAALTDIERAAIVQACENTSARYAYFLDTADYEGMPTAFAPDGVWEVLSNHMQGPTQIRDYWKSRTARWAPNEGWFHQISNQRIDVVDRDHAVGVAFFSVYKYDKTAGANKSLSPLVLSRSSDEYVRTDKGWLLAKRHIERVADVAP